MSYGSKIYVNVNETTGSMLCFIELTVTSVDTTIPPFTTSIFLQVVDYPTLPIQIESSSTTITNTASLTLSVVNPLPSYEYSWTVTGDFAYENCLRPDTDSSFLVVTIGAFQPGYSYLFAVEVFDTNTNLTGAAYFQAVAALGPCGGIFEYLPLGTINVLTLRNWSPQYDSPALLRYQFSFRNAGNQNEFPLTDIVTQNFIVFRLIPGGPIEFVGRVFESDGAMTETILQVTTQQLPSVAIDFQQTSLANLLDGQCVAIESAVSDAVSLMQPWNISLSQNKEQVLIALKNLLEFTPTSIFSVIRYDSLLMYLFKSTDYSTLSYNSKSDCLNLFQATINQINSLQLALDSPFLTTNSIQLIDLTSRMLNVAPDPTLSQSLSTIIHSLAQTVVEVQFIDEIFVYSEGSFIQFYSAKYTQSDFPTLINVGVNLQFPGSILERENNFC